MTKEIILAANLAPLSGIHHAFFTKAWGNGGFSSEEDLERLKKTRAPMEEYLHIAPQHLLCCNQIHSTDVVTVTKLWSSNAPKADALVTNRPGIAVGILTADCGPILFADHTNRVIGAAHAGWRGALSGIIENTITAMEKLGASKHHIHAALGPCISQHSYEVGPEFPAPFLAENPENQRFFRNGFKSDHYQFDLPAYITAKLRSLGLFSIEGSPADTCGEPDRFFSHRYSTLRNEKREGNLMSAIALV
jgi:YfiH family protein